MGLRIVLLACILPFICPFFIQFSLFFAFRLFRICVTVFFATYLLLLLYSSALLKQCSGAIVRFSDSSSYLCFESDSVIKFVSVLFVNVLPSWLRNADQW